MNKKELIKLYRDRHEEDLTVAQATHDVNLVCKLMEEAILNGELRLSDLFIIKQKISAKKKVTNPQTGKAMTLPEHYSVRFKLCKAVSDQLRAKKVPKAKKAK